MGAAGSTVYYNLRLRHPTLEMPLIDYDLALLFQPMLMLGISIGVAFNVMFADWMVTVLLIILFLGIIDASRYQHQPVSITALVNTATQHNSNDIIQLVSSFIRTRVNIVVLELKVIF